MQRYAVIDAFLVDAELSGFAVFGRAAAAFKKDVVLVRVVVCVCGL